MVRRRNVLVGAAGVLGTVAVGAGLVDVVGGPGRALANESALARAPAAGFPLPGSLLCPVPYLSRAGWGADESWRLVNGAESWPVEHHPVQALTVHHTGFAADPDPAVTVRGIYHQQALTVAQGGMQGWGDIGYNLLIDDAGVVYEGRHSGSSFPVFGPADGLMTTGAHVLYYNSGNIGVCLLGYLDDVPATQAAQDSLAIVLAYLAAATGVNPLGPVNYLNPVARPDGTHTSRTVKGISGHRDWAATDCPGNALYPLLGGIRQRAAAGMPSVPKPSPTTGPTSSAPPSGTGQLTPTPPRTTPPTVASTSGGERGGDEYVAPARSASPSAFPTKRRSASPSPSPTPTPTPTPTIDAVTAGPSWATPGVTPTPAALTAAAANLGWGVPATAAAGITVAGAVGGWWLRRRRSAASSRPAAPSTADDQAGVPAPGLGPEPGPGLLE